MEVDLNRKEIVYLLENSVTGELSNETTKMVEFVNRAFEKDDKSENVEETVLDFKHLNENYDVHLDKHLPETLHRGDIVSVNRFLGYHDPMMATCATFLVLPLRNLKKMVTDEDFKSGHLPHGDYIHANTLPEYLSGMTTEFVTFFLGFLIICTIWESNNVRTLVIKRTDDFLVTLGLLQMFAIIVLPFSMALQGHYPQESVAVIMTVIIVIIYSTFEILMILYGFANPRLLHLVLRDWSKKERLGIFMAMIIKPLFDIFIVGIAGAFTLFDYRASWVLFALLILWPLIRRIIFYIRREIAGERKENSCRFFWYFTKGQISKERIEVFTDAAIAIIACVMILDITVEEFPLASKVKKEGLVSVLLHMKSDFLVFFGVYLGVSILWYLNHTILYLYHTLDNVALYLQKIYLALLCITPICNNMLHKFGPKENHESQVAALCTGIVFFAAGMTQLLMLLWGIKRSKTNAKLLHKWATSDNEINKKQLRYTLLKCLVIPVCTMLCIAGYFSPGRYPSFLAGTSVSVSFITFTVLKFTFMNHFGEEEITVVGRELDISSGEMEMRKEMQNELSEGRHYEEDH